METGCVSAMVWIPRGVAKSDPKRYVPTEEDFANKDFLEPTVNEKEEDEEEEQEQEEEEEMVDVETEQSGENAIEKKKTKEEEEISKKYNMDDYDQEETMVDSQSLYKNIDDLIVMDDDMLDEDSQDDESIEELRILSSDSLLLTSVTDDEEHSAIHMYVMEGDEDDRTNPSDVYSVERGNLYLHHDIPLPAFPLCLEWMNFNVSGQADQSTTGNFVAVGTFLPMIEIWDLDVVDDIQPVAVLGKAPEPSAGGKNKKKKKKKKGTTAVGSTEDTHTDAILGLSWNKYHRNVLASCSADKTVKLWQLDTQKCLHTYTHHTDKVGAIAWNTADPNLLLSGAFDRVVSVFDVRAPQAGAVKWEASGEIECVSWNPYRPSQFLVSTDDGNITLYDTLSPGKSLYTLRAHDKEVSALSFNPRIPNLLASASADKTIKLWDISGQPSLLQTVPSPFGRVFSLSFCGDRPLNLGVGGGSANVNILNCGKFASVNQAFGSVISGGYKELPPLPSSSTTTPPSSSSGSSSSSSSTSG
eukprot:CAMPEP_0201479944 /NCGR_PEP_ID=MMETSP0151_2-20130828/4560_1 /ASSEMBLY_ACC=CAM_ASM_000257 /TAXON_ID=200890 /ORGANISM="Paramoeba atlantica, Strain 621/1 / CCAP 1560/9" /LENGTH=527 /DNA_ID=CAMNT_0047861661 /DNA_START=30 /DNA_END=1613 /DNA_ORIENTATION=-